MVSVIIPTFGNPIFLEKAIRSVTSQTIDDWELIVVDDNNAETEARMLTEEVMSIFSDNRIKYIKHPHNKNGVAARNTALRVAKGEYICFLDSDDEYMPNRLEECVRVMKLAGGDFAGVYTGCEFRRRGKTYLRYKNVKSGKFIVETLACRFMFCTGSNIFVRRAVIDELNGFDEAFLRHQDYEFLVRLFEKYSLIALPDILVIKNNENVNMPDVVKMESVKKRYLEKFNRIINKLTKEEQSYIFYANYISLAELSISQKDFAQGRHFYSLARQNKSLTFIDNMRRLGFYLRAYLTSGS